MVNLIQRILGSTGDEDRNPHRGSQRFLEEVRQLSMEDRQAYVDLRSAFETVEADYKKERESTERKTLDVSHLVSSVETPQDYIVLEGNDFYPDLLVAKQKTHFGKNWYQAHEALHEENQVMLTIRQFVDFVNHLRSGTVYDGTGTQLPSLEIDQILKEIVEKRNPWRAEWLDADFKVKDKVLYINYNHRTVDGQLVPQVSEPVQMSLMNNCFADVFGSADSQGLPIQTNETSGIYYWTPMSDNSSVAGFRASSSRVDLDCGRGPQGSISVLGVRSAQQRV